MTAELAERREVVEAELVGAVRSARQAHRSWSEIGTMLGSSCSFRLTHSVRLHRWSTTMGAR